MDEMPLLRAEQDAEQYGLPCERCRRHACQEEADTHFDVVWGEGRWRPWVCGGCLE